MRYIEKHFGTPVVRQRCKERKTNRIRNNKKMYKNTKIYYEEDYIM